MPKYVDDAGLVERWIEQKQQLEVMLAWDLLETFNTTPDLIDPLRAMTDRALDEMLRMDRESVDAAIAEEKGRPNLQVLNHRLVLLSRTLSDSVHRPRSQVLQVQRQADLASIRVEDLDAQYASELIRIYGTAVEKAARKGLEKYMDLDREKGELRKGAPGDGSTRDVWGKDEELAWGRHRRGAGWTPKGTVDVGMRAKEELATLRRRHPTSGRSYEQQVQAADITEVHRFLIYQQGGQQGFELADNSTIGRIDRVFGLVPAMDISGTTTDTLFFLNRFREQVLKNYVHALDPIFCLLPLASIVAGAHHSMLEVALALALNDKIDYHVGFYETLMPKRRGFPGHLGIVNIAEALRAAQTDPRNHLILACYSGPHRVAGGYRFEPFDRPFREFARALDVVRTFRTVPPWPTQRQLFKLCCEHELF